MITDDIPAVRCCDPPDWATHGQQPADGTAVDETYTSNGVDRLLCEIQVDLRGPGFAKYIRTVQRVRTRSGAERLANFAVEFDPALDSVDVHRVRVVRDGTPTDHARAQRFQVLRRETNLEKLVLNGRFTAALLIPDLQVGDVLELALTFHTNHPLLQGRYADVVTYDSFNPWARFHHRLLRPARRSVLSRTFNDFPAGQPRDGTQEDVVWSLDRRERQEPEALALPWVNPLPRIQHTEFASWNEVARLFAPFYESSTELPEDLATQLDRIGAEHADPSERAAAWLRTIQGRVRYFALSLGEGALVPRALDDIWRSQFGDCKDVARLYVAGAGRLGLDACAALVSTTHGMTLDEFLPSPSVFNHCIVSLRLDGTTYWLDPTHSTQCGTLRNIFQPHLGWALRLSAETSELSRLGDVEQAHAMACRDDFEVASKVDAPVLLRRQVTYRAWMADAARAAIANAGVQRFAEQVLKGAQEMWPATTASAPLEVVDDPRENSFTVIQRLEIQRAWTRKDGRLGICLGYDAIARELAQLTAAPRRADIFLGRPRRLTYDAVLRMPRTWFGAGWIRETGPRGVKHKKRFHINAKTIEWSVELAVSAWSLPAAEAGEYRQLVTTLQENRLIVWGRERFGRITHAGRGKRETLRIAVWVLWVALWLGFTVWNFLHDRH